MIIKTNQLLLSLTLRKRDYLSLKKTLEKDSFIELRKIESDVSLSLQKLIFSFLTFIIDDGYIPEHIKIPYNSKKEFQIQHLKRYISKKYLLGEETEETILFKRNNEIIERKQTLFNYYSWSYLRSNKKQYNKIYNAVSDFSKEIGTPIELYFSNSLYGDSDIERMKSYLVYINNNTCIATNKNIDLNKDRFDLHHTYIHQGKDNERNYPLFIHSVFNLSAISHNFHMNNGSWKDNFFNLNNEDISFIEKKMEENKVLKEWALKPYEYKNIINIKKELGYLSLNNDNKIIVDLIRYNSFL